MTGPDDRTPEESLRAYLVNTRQYLENALRFLAEGEVEKSSEFLWGGMAAVVKAVAMSRGTHLRQHRDIWNYAREFARQTGNEAFLGAFREANSLHGNFYEAGLAREDIEVAIPRIREAISWAIGLIPEEGLRYS